MSDQERLREMSHEWHVVINRFHDTIPHGQWRHWMYEAKDAMHEIPRLAYLHGAERMGKLKKLHRHCSMSPAEPVPDNHLTCCLGVECRKCPELAAIDTANITPEEKDRAKAWTCAVHILMNGGDRMKEGYLLTVDDRMFWDTTYANMSAEPSEGNAQVRIQEKP